MSVNRLGTVFTGVVLASATFALLAAGCATTQGPTAAATTLSSGTPADACRGAQFDADDPDPRCLRGRTTAPEPSAKDLKVSLHADSVAKAGHEAVLVLEIRNVTGAPLVLDVDSACSFSAVATSGAMSSFETDCGGICGRGSEPSVLHVTLEPDGVVVKRVHFYATQLREVMKDKDRCEQHSAGALPPGRYQLKVTLPWSDPSPENPGMLLARTAEVPITVTP